MHFWWDCVCIKIWGWIGARRELYVWLIGWEMRRRPPHAAGAGNKSCTWIRDTFRGLPGTMWYLLSSFKDHWLKSKYKLSRKLYTTILSSLCCTSTTNGVFLMFTPWSELSTESGKNQLFWEFVELLCLSRGKYHTFWEILRSYDGINK